MAIIPEQPQLQVYVESDGERLLEFDTDENDGNTTTTSTKYIESKSGAEFAVQFELHRPFPQYAMRIRLYIDGKHIHSRKIADIQYQKPRAMVKRAFDNVKSKTVDGQSIMQKFCFSELQIEDLDDYDLDAHFQNLKSMGTITLKAFYIHHLREVTIKGKRTDNGERAKKGEGFDDTQAELGPIPEKALKGEALTHQAGLGRAINLPSGTSPTGRTSLTRTRFDYVNPQGLPFAIFNFKYRSRAALQSLLIIPQSPRSSLIPVNDAKVPMANMTLPKRDVPAATSVKEESKLKREHSTVGAGGNDEVVFVSATKLRTLKEEPGLKREHPAAISGDEDDKDLVLVSATKRRRSNITVNKNGVEIIDLT